MNGDGVEVGCWTLLPDVVDEVAVELKQSNELETLQMVIPFVPQMMRNGVGIGTDAGVWSELRLWWKIKLYYIRK